MKRLEVKAILFCLLGAVAFWGCTTNDLEPHVNGKIDATKVTTVNLLQTVLYGGYERMSSVSYYGRNAVVMDELRSDNCIANGSSNRFNSYSDGFYSSNSSEVSNLWNVIYKTVGQANAVISKENVELEGDAKLKMQLIAEAYTMRALAHYDLLRFFGAQHVSGSPQGIPYITDFPVKNMTPDRTPVAEVRAKLMADIDKAIDLFNQAKQPYEVYRLNVYAAYAIKARIALWFGDWDMVLKSVKPIIESGDFKVMPKAAYVASWKEKLRTNSLFELAFSSTDNNQINGMANIFKGDSYADVAVTQNLVDVFEATDLRGSAAMIGINELLKKKNPRLDHYIANLGKYLDYQTCTDNLALIRYEEVILMQAEAYYKSGDQAQAIDALTLITSERGATAPTEVTDDVILNERRKELCFEGFRFNDLARYGKGVPFLYQGKASFAYGERHYTLPIPQDELNSNTVIKQALGY